MNGAVRTELDPEPVGLGADSVDSRVAAQSLKYHAMLVIVPYLPQSVTNTHMVVA